VKGLSKDAYLVTSIRASLEGIQRYAYVA